MKGKRVVFLTLIVLIMSLNVMGNDRFEIGGFRLTILTDGQTVPVWGINLSYTTDYLGFDIFGMAGEGFAGVGGNILIGLLGNNRIEPYITGGVSTVPFFENMPTIFNAGAGVKLKVIQSWNLRIEYRRLFIEDFSRSSFVLGISYTL